MGAEQQKTLDAVAALVDAGRPFIMATVTEEGKPAMRWMGALAMDENEPHVGYLVCGRNSRKMRQITANPATQMLFSSEDFTCIATISGVCEIVDSQERKQWAWDRIPGAEQYYNSPENPEFGVIRFAATRVEYISLAESHETICIDL